MSRVKYLTVTCDMTRVAGGRALRAGHLHRRGLGRHRRRVQRADQLPVGGDGAKTTFAPRAVCCQDRRVRQHQRHGAAGGPRPRRVRGQLRQGSV